MAFSVNITETPKALLELLSQTQDKSVCKRLEALYIIKTQQAKTILETADILNVSTTIVSTWIRSYKFGGIGSLLESTRHNYADIDVAESTATLLSLLSYEKDEWNYKKLKALYLKKSKIAETSREIAQLLETDEATVSRWLRIYRKCGINILIQQKSYSISCIPNWVTERLLEELKSLDFLPDVKAVHSWLIKVGINVSYSTASNLLATVKHKLELFRKQHQYKTATEENQLLISLDIYASYEQWKSRNNFLNDSQALEQLLKDYFEITSAAHISNPVTRENNLEEPVLSILDTLDTLERVDLDLEVPNSLNQNQLSKRLNVNEMLLSRNRSKKILLTGLKLKILMELAGNGSPKPDTTNPYVSNPQTKNPVD